MVKLQQQGLLLLLIIVTGCGGGPTYEQYFDKANETWCDFQVRCCNADAATCIAKRQQDSADVRARVQAQITAGKLVYHPDAAQACLDREAASFDHCDDLFRQNNPRDCVGVFTGAIAVGQPCNNDDGDYCAPGAACPSPGSGAQAVCTPVVPEGGACSSQTICEYGTTCGPSGTCVPPLADGEACANVLQCDSLVCESTCQPATKTFADAFCNP